MTLRVRKEDSAYLYQILESYEGCTNFSTVDESKGASHRDIALHIAPDFRSQVEKLVSELQKEIEITLLE